MIMRRGSAVGLALVVGMGVGSLAQTLSGSLGATAEIGFRDVTIAAPGQTISMPAETVACAGGSVTIPDHDIAVTVNGQIVTVTIPGDTYDTTEPLETVTIPDRDITVTVGDTDVDIAVPGGTYPCTGGAITIPAYDIVVAGHTHTLRDIPVFAIDSELVVNYNLEVWSFGFDTVLDETGWTRQSFAASGTLGRVALTSRLAFAPSNPSAFFTQWMTVGRLTLGGVTTVGTFSLTPGDIRLSLDASGALGDVHVRAITTFGDITPAGRCDVGWQGVDIMVDFPLGCAEIRSTISFDCLGFEALTFLAEDIVIPSLPWATLRALVTFTTDEKTLTLTPSFDFGDDDCFDLYIGASWGGNVEFLDVSVDGIALSCYIGKIRFTGQSYWGTGSKPSLLAGTPYWEAYQIASTEGECCGPFDFDVTVYFLEGILGLFDVGEIAGNLSVKPGARLTFSTGFAIKLAPSTSLTWTLAFLVDW